MSTAYAIADTVQEQVIDTVKQAQDFVLAGVRSVADVVSSFAPELPELPADLPTPAEAVESGFSFAKKMLDLQHAFVSDVLAATIPAAPADAAAAK